MFAPYVFRPLAFLGIERIAGYRFKIYTICYGTEPFERNRFASGWTLATACLPSPATTNERPGLGFAILHQGQTGDYLVLCWWDRENELPTRVFLNDGSGWRSARNSESFCVWDLEVIWSERNAYVSTILNAEGGNFDGYLEMVAVGNA